MRKYTVKVLLPEFLIKICTRIYKCDKDSADKFLNSCDINLKYPEGSKIFD